MLLVIVIVIDIVIVPGCHAPKSYKECLRLSAAKSKIKGRSLVWFTFCPDFAAVPLNDAVYGRKPDTGALKVIMQTLKSIENFIRISVIKSDAIVFDKKYRLIINPGFAEFDTGFILSGCEFPDIVHQVQQHNS